MEPKLRLARQKLIFEWGCAAFTTAQMKDPRQRGLRLMEETIEAAQAAGCDKDQLHRLVDYVYGRPVGILAKELGGVGVCTLALAECIGIDADEAEEEEITRIFSKPVDVFSQRNKEKNDAGFKAT